MEGEGRFRLGYWNIRGLAQAPRLLFELQGVKYVDELYSQGGPEANFEREQWLAKKPELLKETPFANLPYLRDSELPFLLTESKVSQCLICVIFLLFFFFRKAILQHLGRVFDYYGDDETEKSKIDNVVYAVEDMRSACTGLCYNPQFDEKRAAAQARVGDKLVNLEKWIASQTTDHIASKRLSIADLFVYEVLEIVKHLFPDLYSADKTPHCVKFHDKIHNLEKVVAFRESDRFLSNFNNKIAYWGGGARK